MAPQLIVLLVNCLGEIFNAATPWTLDTADISPGGISQPPSLASWLRGGAHVPRPSSRLHSCLVEIFTASRTAVQFSRIGVKTVTLASWRFFSTLWIFKFSPLCAFKCILPWSGSWLGRALRELESRCCQLRPREIDSRAQIRTRSVLLNRNEKCANCQWQLLQMKLVQDLRLGERAIALNLNPNHQLHRIQRSI